SCGSYVPAPRAAPRRAAPPPLPGTKSASRSNAAGRRAARRPNARRASAPIPAATFLQNKRKPARLCAAPADLFYTGDRASSSPWYRRAVFPSAPRSRARSIRRAPTPTPSPYFPDGRGERAFAGEKIESRSSSMTLNAGVSDPRPGIRLEGAVAEFLVELPGGCGGDGFVGALSFFNQLFQVLCDRREHAAGHLQILFRRQRAVPGNHLRLCVADLEHHFRGMRHPA